MRHIGPLRRMPDDTFIVEKVQGWDYGLRGRGYDLLIDAPFFSHDLIDADFEEHAQSVISSLAGGLDDEIQMISGFGGISTCDAFRLAAMPLMSLTSTVEQRASLCGQIADDEDRGACIGQARVSGTATGFVDAVCNILNRPKAPTPSPPPPPAPQPTPQTTPQQVPDRTPLIIGGTLAAVGILALVLLRSR